MSVQYRMDGNLYNLRRLLAKSKTLVATFMDLLSADDYALVAQSADDIQHIVNCFHDAALAFGLQI